MTKRGVQTCPQCALFVLLVLMIVLSVSVGMRNYAVQHASKHEGTYHGNSQKDSQPCRKDTVHVVESVHRFNNNAIYPCMPPGTALQVAPGSGVCGPCRNFAKN